MRLATTPSVDFDAVKSFVDEAKTVGHARVATFESQIGRRRRFRRQAPCATSTPPDRSLSQTAVPREWAGSSDPAHFAPGQTSWHAACDRAGRSANTR